MEHDRSNNPYDDMDEYLEEKQTQRLQDLCQSSGVVMSKRHTDVFKPENIREFSKHMDVRTRAKNISLLCLGVAAIAVAAVMIYLFIALNLTLTKYILVYAAVMIFLGVFINREKSKRLVIAYAVFAFLCILLGIVFGNNVKQICDNPRKMIFAYLPLVIQCIMGVLLYRTVWEFHEAWNTYQSSGIVPAEQRTLREKLDQINEWLKYR